MHMLPAKQKRRHLRETSDHVDAWLISYADLITLLFMLFVIFVSVAVSKGNQPALQGAGASDYEFKKERSGTLALGTPYDEAYRNLKGVVLSHNADQSVSVEKSEQSVWIDLSATSFFKSASADIPPEKLPLLKAIARVLKASASGDYVIEVEGHTDDVALQDGSYVNNWDLAAMRATHLVNLLIAEGVDPTHLRAVSYAGTRPLVPNLDSAGHAIAENRERNQRMVIKLGPEMPRHS